MHSFYAGKLCYNTAMQHKKMHIIAMAIIPQPGKSMNILKPRELVILTLWGRRRLTSLPICHDTLVARNARPTALTSRGAGGLQEVQFQRICYDLGCYDVVK